MIQSVLSEKKWMDIMIPEDLRALSPLIYSHVNPYGIFTLDMMERIPIEERSGTTPLKKQNHRNISGPVFLLSNIFLSFTIGEGDRLKQ